MKRPGKTVLLEDGRHGIIYDDQPLMASSGKLVIYLTDDKYNKLLDENGGPKTLIWSEQKYLEMINSARMTGFID